MPLYNYHCVSCKVTFEQFSLMADRESCACLSCGEVAKQAPSAPQFHRFPEGVFEHIAADPLYISDKRQLRGACDEHQVYAPNLLDS